MKLEINYNDIRNSLLEITNEIVCVLERNDKQEIWRFKDGNSLANQNYALYQKGIKTTIMAIYTSDVEDETIMDLYPDAVLHSEDVKKGRGKDKKKRIRRTKEQLEHTNSSFKIEKELKTKMDMYLIMINKQEWEYISELIEQDLEKIGFNSLYEQIKEKVNR